MLVVTGFGRCGTSLIAKWLQACCLLPYEATWFDQINAGLEPLDVCEINNKIIGLNFNGAEYVCSEPAPAGALAEQIKAISYPVFKCPRFMYGNVLQEWLSVRKDLSFVIMLRNFDAIHNSRVKMRETLGGTGDNMFIKTPDEMRLLLGNAVQLLVANRIYFKFLYFPDFIDNYTLVEDRFHQYLPLPKNAKELWLQTADKSKIHHRAAAKGSPSALAAGGILPFQKKVISLSNEYPMDDKQQGGF